MPQLDFFYLLDFVYLALFIILSSYVFILFIFYLKFLTFQRLPLNFFISPFLQNVVFMFLLL